MYPDVLVQIFTFQILFKSELNFLGGAPLALHSFLMVFQNLENGVGPVLEKEFLGIVLEGPCNSLFEVVAFESLEVAIHVEGLGIAWLHF